MKKILILSYLLLFLIQIIFAENYYVSMNGSDSNSGLLGAPWRTLQYAVNRLSAGDTLTVEDGTYTGFYMDRRKGTETQRIIIRARNRWGAIINQPPPGRQRNVEFLSCTYVTFDGFEVTGAQGAGIAVRTFENETTGINSRDNIIQYCYSHHNGSNLGSHDGIFTGFAMNVTIQYNVCSYNGEHGIYVSNSADNPIIRGNIIYGNFNNGIHINSDATVGGDGIISNWLVEDNIIYDNGRTGINVDGASNGICRNNLLYNNRAGIALYRIDGAQGASNNLIVNNTIYTFLAPTTPNTGSLRAALNISNASNYNTVFNNIIYAEGTTGATAAFYVDSDVVGLSHDYNIVGRFGNNTPHFYGTTISPNEVTPQPNTIFNNIANNDYTLIPGCLAIDRGINIYNFLAAPLNDINGVTRPQAAGFDIGCYEMLAGTTTPTNTRTRTTTPTINTITNTITRTQTATVTRTHTATLAISQTPTSSFTPTRTITGTSARTVTATATATATITGSQIPTSSFTPTRTITGTSTRTVTTTAIATVTITGSQIPTSSFTPTRTTTGTSTRTVTATATEILTGTPLTQTWTQTPMFSFTKTPSFTISITYTNTPIHTQVIKIEEDIKIHDCVIFPNPFFGDSDILISFSSNKQPEKKIVEIYTVGLRKIYEQTEYDIVNYVVIKKDICDKFSNGIYLYRLKLCLNNKESYSVIKPFIIINKR